MFDPSGLIPTSSAKAPAVLDVAAQHAPTLSDMAGSILDGLRSIAENPSLPLEEIGIGVAAIASVAGTIRTLQEYRRDRGEERTKQEALRAARRWAEADGSLVAYASKERVGMEAALISATADINRFMPRSDVRAQALDIAMKMPKEERLDTAAGFEDALSSFSKVMPKDAGVAHNHATLARLATDPVEACAAAERAAFGTIERGDAPTGKARAACFSLLQASACRAVALDRDEMVQEVIQMAPPPRRFLRRQRPESR